MLFYYLTDNKETKVAKNSVLNGCRAWQLGCRVVSSSICRADGRASTVVSPFPPHYITLQTSKESLIVSVAVQSCSFRLL